MKSVEIPDSLYEAIVEIGKLRKTQNNRATGDPLYFSVEDVGLGSHAKKQDIYNYVYSNHKGESKEVIHSVLSELCELSYKEV